MFTDCPSCNRQFRVGAGHLSAAHGLVKCGYCGTQFNALERLHDSLLPVRPAGDLAVDIPASDNHEPEPEFEIPEARPEPEASANADAEPQWKGQSPDIDEVQPVTEPEPDEALDRREKTPDLQEHKYTGAALETDPRELAELLLEAPANVARGRGRWWWVAGAVLLFIAGTAQFLWFQRDEVLSRYPELMPWVEKFCARFECNVIRFRDVSAIKLLNRDVREHPRYEHALLVNATMSNESRLRQPYPDIQLSLYDTEGKLIGQRIFKPHDYLDDSIDTAQGMAPNIPVHFVLEVTGRTDGAVSFEFKFL